MVGAGPSGNSSRWDAKWKLARKTAVHLASVAVCVPTTRPDPGVGEEAGRDDDDRGRGDDPSAATPVEVHQGGPPLTVVPSATETGDDEPRDHEEDVHTDVAAADPGESCVVEDHQQHGDGSETLDVGPELPVARGGSRFVPPGASVLPRLEAAGPSSSPGHTRWGSTPARLGTASISCARVTSTSTEPNPARQHGSTHYDGRGRNGRALPVDTLVAVALGTPRPVVARACGSPAGSRPRTRRSRQIGGDVVLGGCCGRAHDPNQGCLTRGHRRRNPSRRAAARPSAATAAAAAARRPVHQ